MRSLLALFFLFIFFAGCNSDKVPSGVIPEKKMVGVLTDMHLADGYTSTLDSYRDSIEIATVYQTLYKRYDTDSAQIHKSLDYYSQHPEVLQKIYKQVNDNLGKIQMAEQKKEQDRIKLEEKAEKLRQKALAKKLKMQKDSLRRDSIRRVKLRIDSLKRDSVKRDSIKKVQKKRVEAKRNGISAKRNR